jgi:K+-sensing histidine kinase KdpD
MPDQTTILVPIRYPLTDNSARTLAAAGRLAHDHAPAELRVLHVNLFQNEDNTQTEELTRAISSTLEGVEASVTTRRGFLVEEVILEEATQIDADIVVIGANQRAIWRRFLSRLLQNDPEVGSFLRENTTDEIEIIEVDTTAETPTAESV